MVWNDCAHTPTYVECRYTTFNVTADGGANESPCCTSTCILIILLLLHSSCILRIHAIALTDIFVWSKKSFSTLLGQGTWWRSPASLPSSTDYTILANNMYAIDVIGKCCNGCQIVMHKKREKRWNQENMSHTNTCDGDDNTGVYD